MKGKQIFLFIFLFPAFSPMNLAGQADFKPGSIISNDGIETKCLIDIKGWKQNPYLVKFRENDKSEVISYSPSEIKGFNVENESYISAGVLIDISPVSKEELISTQIIDDRDQRRSFYDANNISTEKIVPAGEIRYRIGDSVVVLKPDNKEAMVFLKTLVAGKLNLCYFKDRDKKDHYYVSNESGNYEELNRLFYADNTKSIRLVVYEVEYFKPQLLKYMTGDSSFQDKVLKLSFTKKALSDIFLDYNKNSGK